MYFHFIIDLKIVVIKSEIIRVTAQQSFKLRKKLIIFSFVWGWFCLRAFLMESNLVFLQDH